MDVLVAIPRTVACPAEVQSPPRKVRSRRKLVTVPSAVICAENADEYVHCLSLLGSTPWSSTNPLKAPSVWIGIFIVVSQL
jgi:hypothetical protein